MWLVESLLRAGFEKPTQVQTEVLQAALHGGGGPRRDVIAASETGSGKTLAFGLAALQGAARMAALTKEGKPKQGPHALVLAPTRELALQSAKNLKAVAGDRVRVSLIVGGLAVEKQYRELSQRPPIVVATPGRLMDLVRAGDAWLSKLHTVKLLVIDEADKMSASCVPGSTCLAPLLLLTQSVSFSSTGSARCATYFRSSTAASCAASSARQSSCRRRYTSRVSCASG